MNNFSPQATKTDIIMKKVYIIPAVEVHKLNMKDGIMLYTSDTTKASSDADVETKGSDDYDLWDE